MCVVVGIISALLIKAEEIHYILIRGTWNTLGKTKEALLMGQLMKKVEKSGKHKTLTLKRLEFIKFTGTNINATNNTQN
jgi:hypothetical protein